MFLQNLSTTCFLAIALLGSFAAAQPPTASFAYPPQVTGTTPLLIINVVDTITFQWTSNFKEAFLWVFCDEGTPGDAKVYLWANYSVPISGNATYSPFFNSDLKRDWKPNRPFNCHADLNYQNVHNSAINGPLFNVTSIASQRATTYAAQYTTTGNPPDGNARITIASSTATTTPISTSSPSSTLSPPPVDTGLSTGGIAGVAIGVVAGLGALVALGFMVWRNKRKVNRLESRIPDDNMNQYSKPQGVEVVQPYQDDLHPVGTTAPSTKYAMEADNRTSMYGGNGAVPVELEPLPSPQELPSTSSPTRIP